MLCPFYSIKHAQNKYLSYLNQVFQEVKVFWLFRFWSFLVDFVFILSWDKNWNVCTGMLVMYLILICGVHFIYSSRKCKLQHSFGNSVNMKHWTGALEGRFFLDKSAVKYFLSALKRWSWIFQQNNALGYFCYLINFYPNMTLNAVLTAVFLHVFRTLGNFSLKKKMVFILSFFFRCNLTEAVHNLILPDDFCRS